MPRNIAHHFFVKAAFFCSIFSLAACGSAPSAHHNDVAEATPPSADSFEMASTIGEDELSDMRGGFITPGGLQINFGLTTTTMVNGIIASNFTFTSGNLAAKNLQQIIQVGGGNSISGSTPSTLGSTVLTVVQNNTNNSTIQNSNVLNLTVSNLANLRNNAALANSVGPLIRSLH